MIKLTVRKQRYIKRVKMQNHEKWGYEISIYACFTAHQSLYDKCIDEWVHALECIMGNQGKMERNSKVCKEVQNDEKY